MYEYVCILLLNKLTIIYNDLHIFHPTLVKKTDGISIIVNTVLCSLGISTIFANRVTLSHLWAQRLRGLATCSVSDIAKEKKKKKRKWCHCS